MVSSEGYSRTDGQQSPRPAGHDPGSGAGSGAGPDAGPDADAGADDGPSPQTQQRSAKPSAPPSSVPVSSSASAVLAPAVNTGSDQHHAAQQPSQPQAPSQSQPHNNNQQKVTVETETVPSVTTLGVNPTSTLRIKRSQDSVPRYNSAKGANKRRSLRLAQGSKADIFAAKVANAVEEQDSSDDETFVYQAPIGPSSHAPESFRRPYRRTMSNASSQLPHTPASYYQSDGYFNDMVPVSDPDFEPSLPRRNSAHIDSDETPISPTRSVNTLQPRHSHAQLSSSTIGNNTIGNNTLGNNTIGDQTGLHNNGIHNGGFNNGSNTNSAGNAENADADLRTNVNANATGGANFNAANNKQQGSSQANPPQSPRNFVVPKPARNFSQPQGAIPHTGPSSSSSSAVAPYMNGLYHDSDGAGFEDGRDPMWNRHSRQNSRNRVYSTSELVSPTKDPNDSIRAKHLYLQRWRISASSANQLPSDDVSPDEVLDERASLLKGRPSLYNYQSSRNSYGRRRDNPLTLSQQQQLQQQRRYGQPPQNFFDNQAGVNNDPNLNGQQPFMGGDVEYSPTDSTFTKFHNGASFCTRVMIGASLVLIIVLSLVFVTGVLLAAARPLREFDVVALSDVLVSDRELVFSMITRARNPGLFSRVINYGELDIFATSSHAETSTHHTWGQKKQTRTILLGTIMELESPILFRGGMSSSTQWRSASAKLVGPLSNNTALWSEISAYEFDLTVKGVLMYRVLGGEHRETVSRTYHVMSPEVSDEIHAII